MELWLNAQALETEYVETNPGFCLSVVSKPYANQLISISLPSPVKWG